MNQLGLFNDEAGPALTPAQERKLMKSRAFGPVYGTPSGPAEDCPLLPPATLRERLMVALRRDLDSLRPEHRDKMSPDIPGLIRERVADYRQRLAEEA